MTSVAARIFIVGLGPGSVESRTVGVQRVLDTADRIILRTRIHPGLADLESDPRVTDCDDLYERETAFEGLYLAVANRVLDAARVGGTVVYAVPGHPRFAERSVPLIEAAAGAQGIPTEVLDAVSFVDAVVGVTKADPLTDGLQIADAEYLAATVDADPFAAGQLGLDPSRPLIVAQIYNANLAAAVKLALARLYPDEHEIIVLKAAGIISEQVVRTIALHALDRETTNHLTSLWVPPLSHLEAVRSSDSLSRLVARLRAPGGCPWDREQTHASLRNPVLAEAYEVVDAIDSGDDDGLSDELGDLLLLVSMHAQIAEESGTFRIEDVVEGINRKLVRRHPHVFGTVSANTPQDVISTWEGVKEAERTAKGDPPIGQNPLGRLPRSMPVTRKIIELLAPRTSLKSSDDSHAGDTLLAELISLIEQGLDPERALEDSLKNFLEHRNERTRPVAMPGAEIQSRREQA